LSAVQVAKCDPEEVWAAAIKFKEWFENEYNTVVHSLDWHRDEGGIDVETGKYKINEHLHMIWANVDNDGQMIRRKWSKKMFEEHQTKVAEFFEHLGFRRGRKYSEEGEKAPKSKHHRKYRAEKQKKQSETIADLHQKVKQMEAELATLKQVKEQYRQERDRLKASGEATQRDYMDLKKLYDDLKNSAKAQKLTIEELRSQLTVTEADKEKAEKEKKEAEKRAEEAEKREKEALARAEAAEAEKERLEAKKKASTEKQLADRIKWSAEKKQMQKEITEKDAVIASQKEQIETIEEEKETWHDRAERLLQHKQKEENGEVPALRAEKERLEAEIVQKDRIIGRYKDFVKKIAYAVELGGETYSDITSAILERVDDLMSMFGKAVKKQTERRGGEWGRPKNTDRPFKIDDEEEEPAPWNRPRPGF
jgi:chromosome segregation ATPase